MAFFVFFAAAARARIVAPDFRLVTPHRLDARVVAADARGSRGTQWKSSRG
jgi:hypothetical protein